MKAKTPSLGLTLPLVLSLCGAVACSSGSTTPDPDAPPPGCQHTSAECPACENAIQTWDDCLNAAVIDPTDPAGCNSGSHACWTQPHCNAYGTSSS